MRIRYARTVGVLAAAFTLIAPGTARGWSPPLGGSATLVTFGVACPTGTHRGIDFAGEDGESVNAPVAGEVLFAGQVPADGGGTCGAVTLSIAGGLRLSLLPLAEVFVSEGDALGAGEALGTLAGTGDASSAAPHLHVGLRRGDLYLDPASLIAGSAPDEPPTREGADVAVNAPEASAAGTGVAVTIGEASIAASPTAPRVPVGSPTAVGEAVSADGASEAGVPGPAAEPVRSARLDRFRPAGVRCSLTAPTSAVARGIGTGRSLPFLPAPGVASVLAAAGIAVAALMVMRPDGVRVR
jgi:murein DD-endopeptidase MepM/ murein hydrolase activator NlpD